MAIKLAGQIAATSFFPCREIVYQIASNPIAFHKIQLPRHLIAEKVSEWSRTKKLEDRIYRPDMTGVKAGKLYISKFDIDIYSEHAHAFISILKL